MAGHSKWANIKHKKTREDARRGKIFTKLIKEITIAAQQNGGDVATNSRLRLLVEKGKKANMPQENITRAIKKGTGQLSGATYEEGMYQGYGPGGIAVIIETLTDNKNRTISNIRHIFTKKGGNLTESSTVLWMFTKKGVIALSTDELSQNDVLEKLIDYQIEDIIAYDDSITVLCATNELNLIKQACEQEKLHVESSQVEWIAKETINLHDVCIREKAYDFLQTLEDNQDVQNVYTNLK